MPQTCIKLLRSTVVCSAVRMSCQAMASVNLLALRLLCIIFHAPELVKVLIGVQWLIHIFVH